MAGVEGAVRRPRPDQAILPTPADRGEVLVGPEAAQ